MKSKKTIALVLVVAAASVIAFFMTATHTPETPRQIAVAPKTSQPAVVVTQPDSTPPVEQSNTVASTVDQTPVTVTAVAQTLAPQNTQADESQDYHTARAALGLVGVDPDAEGYWMDAIYNLQLSDSQREDLMEDLNEEGFSDPQNPGPDDALLIVNRLRIIKDIAPYADDFMLEHLTEAYKDLREMLAGMAGR